MLWAIVSAQNQQTNQSKALIHGKTSRILINKIVDDQFQFLSYKIKLRAHKYCSGRSSAPKTNKLISRKPWFKVRPPEFQLKIADDQFQFLSYKTSSELTNFALEDRQRPKPTN